MPERSVTAVLYNLYMSEMSVTDARERFAEAIDQARSGDAVFITKHGRPVVVMIDADEYERLIDAIEDAEDRAAVDLADKDGEWIPWEQVKADLGLE